MRPFILVPEHLLVRGGRLDGQMFSSASLFQYTVDDLLILLEASTSPVWIGILTITGLCLGIPMSWHKTSVGPQVTWIGWQINVKRWVITPDKRTKILSQLDTLLRSSTCDHVM